jgi:hypothetical protein
MEAKRKGKIVQIALLVLILCASQPMSSAQCTQQPPNGASSLAPGSIAYYSIDSTITSLPALSTETSPAAQIIAAFAAWTAANTQPGGDGITFVQASGTQTASVIVTADSGTSSTDATYVGETLTPIGVISAANPATITFYPNSVIPNTSTNFFQALQTGYSTAYLQAALHEIAHLQGIGDYNPESSAPPPGPNTSVVIPFLGVNDINNTYQKTGPTPCDVQQAKTSSAAIAAAAAASRSGGGGGGPTKGDPPVPPDQPPGSGSGSGGNGSWDGSATYITYMDIPGTIDET